ncbi:MAG: hypothetical protein ACOH2N_02730 [Devosia sp.]
MAFTDTTFKTVMRAALVSAALGASSLAAAPAFAQGGSLGFSMEIGGRGGDQSFGNGQRRDRHNDRYDGRDDGYRMRCLTTREAARAISGYGYSQVEIVREWRGERLQMQAVKGKWLYSMRLDLCTGAVDNMQRIGRAYRGGHDRGDFNDGGFSNGGFGFRFNFGN